MKSTALECLLFKPKLYGFWHRHIGVFLDERFVLNQDSFKIPMNPSLAKLADVHLHAWLFLGGKGLPLDTLKDRGCSDRNLD